MIEVVIDHIPFDGNAGNGNDGNADNVNVTVSPALWQTRQGRPAKGTQWQPNHRNDILENDDE